MFIPSPKSIFIFRLFSILSIQVVREETFFICDDFISEWDAYITRLILNKKVLMMGDMEIGVGLEIIFYVFFFVFLLIILY